MCTTTRLLLPFTGGINAQALDYALQLTRQRQAALVPLALIPVRPNKGARLEHIQQAQDFLELTRRKAERQGVTVEPARIYTRDIALSVEAVAGEMECEAVLLFLCNTDEVFLGHAEIRALMDRSICNMHLILLPDKRKRRADHLPLHIAHWKRRDDDTCEEADASYQREDQAGKRKIWTNDLISKFI